MGIIKAPSEIHLTRKGGRELYLQRLYLEECILEEQGEYILVNIEETEFLDLLQSFRRKVLSSKRTDLILWIERLLFYFDPNERVAFRLANAFGRHILAIFDDGRISEAREIFEEAHRYRHLFSRRAWKSLEGYF